MRVAVHPCDNGGCGWYRLRWPAEVLQAQGHDVVVAEAFDALFLNGQMIRPLIEADVVVLQRPLVQAVVEAIPRIQSLGIAVVVEVDDDFSALPPGHGARRGTSVANDPTYNRMWLRKACERADLVTVTTPELAATYGAHGRVAVIPNYVPASYLTVPSRHREASPTLGWTGSVVTHVGDLDVMGGVVPDVLDQAGARFVSWGVGLTEEALGVKGRVRPWADLRGAYPRQVADLDVGLVPLADNAFNRAKSWLKGMEYAALGVPFIASPRAEYLRLGSEVLPRVLVADDPETWRAALTVLLSNTDRRAEIAELNREAVQDFTYENHADRWWNAWAAAADNRTRQEQAA